jgi:hypothetical protein
MAFKYQNTFNSVQADRPKYNTFDLTNDFKYTFDMGKLVPIFVKDVLPGDSWSLQIESFLRMSPLKSELYHDVKIRHYVFYCRNTLVFPDFEAYIADPGSSINNPYFALSNIMAEGDVADYMGYPLGYTASPDAFYVDAMPAAIYALIYDKWFLNQHLQTEVFQGLVSGGSNGWARIVLENEPFSISWENDYFTAALPQAQLGPSVTLPIVDQKAFVTLDTSSGNSALIKDTSGGTISAGIETMVQSGSTEKLQSWDGSVSYIDAVLDPNSTLVLDSTAAFATVNALREAFALQKYYELANVAGTRYHEFVYAFFGIRTGDLRAGVPEYIGSTTDRMTLSAVMQTAPAQASATSARSPLGTVAGQGIGLAGGRGFRYFAREHGWIMAFITVGPRPAYQQGCPRMYTRSLSDPEAYYNPMFAYLGEDTIYNYELYLSGNSTDDIGTFGYIPRYSDYRYHPNRVAGEMRSSYDHKHLGRKFTSKPLLNESFILCEPDKRIFAVDYGGTSFTNHDIMAHTVIKAIVRRLIPLYGKPGGV